MPTYDYICHKCGHEFEVVHSMVAAPLKNCPKEACAGRKWGRGKVSKKVGAGAGLLFKGGGFYITDYRSEGYKQSAKKESATPPPAAGEAKAAPAKPAAKADKK